MVNKVKHKNIVEWFCAVQTLDSLDLNVCVCMCVQEKKVKGMEMEDKGENNGIHMT